MEPPVSLAVSLPMYIRCLKVYNLKACHQKHEPNICKPTFQFRKHYEILISRQIRRRLEKKVGMYNRETVSKIFPKLEQLKQNRKSDSVEEKIVETPQKTKKKRKIIMVISQNNNIQEKKQDTSNNMMYFTLGVLYFFNFMNVRYQIQRSLGMRLFHVLDFLFYFFFAKFIIRNMSSVNVFRNSLKERRFI